MVNIEFVKPKHSGKQKRLSVQPQHSVPSKITKFTGPHDSPKIIKKDWTDALFQLVPNACLYTIVVRPDSSESEHPDPLGSEGNLLHFACLYIYISCYCSAVILYCQYN